MNKTQLIDALAARIGDRRTAASAVDGLLETIIETVRAGDSVSLTGFGVFETRARAARVARNPRTGEIVDVPATTVPAFRPGVGFRAAVGGAEVHATPAPRATPVRLVSVAAASAVAVAEPPAAEPSLKAKSDTSFATAAPGKKAGKAEKRDKGKQAKSKNDKNDKNDKNKGKKK
ncbi:HU family DNA-binding protein [Pseudonocardia sp.]|jgi:DNA-binding protein HU-beta|uniref:HU family DNA-binding protein n=1 Tax=Pseudonocardia sp. TaxID=60912 RepID=UPI0031FC1A54